MADIIDERKDKIAKRIKKKRKEKYNSQEEFADALAVCLYGKFGGERESIKQATISDWENGKTFPPLDRLIAMSNLLGCDLGYLLCDYDEQTHGVKEICAETGLSEESVTHLCNVKKWGINDAALSAIDFLIQDHFTKGPRSIISLIKFFLDFDGTKNGTAKKIYTDGTIVATCDPASYTENSFTIANNQVIENAVLEEIKNNLLIRKRKIKEGSRNG